MNTQTQAFAMDRSMAACDGSVAFEDAAAFDDAAEFDDGAVSPAVLALVVAALVGGIGGAVLAALAGFGIWGLVGAYMAGNFCAAGLLVVYLGIR